MYYLQSAVNEAEPARARVLFAGGSARLGGDRGGALDGGGVRGAGEGGGRGTVGVEGRVKP